MRFLPSRMKDATTVAQWRAIRFFSVISEETAPKIEKLQGALLYQFVRFGAEKEGKHLAALPEEMQNILNEAYALGDNSCPKNA